MAAIKEEPDEVAIKEAPAKAPEWLAPPPPGGKAPEGEFVPSAHDAPLPAPTLATRHPLGSGDVLDRLVALEVRLAAIAAKLTLLAPEPPTVVDTPYVSQTNDKLDCTMGNWNDMQTEPHSYTYQWRRNGTTNIGTGAATYIVTGADVGQAVDCLVTAKNPQGETAAASNAVIVEAPAAKAESSSKAAPPPPKK